MYARLTRGKNFYVERAVSSVDHCFGLLGHPASYEHLTTLFNRDRPNFSSEKFVKHRAMIEKLFEWAPPYVSEHDLQVRSGTRTARGKLLVAPFLPGWLDSPRQLALARQKTSAACELAAREQVEVLTLGGFTSIIAATGPIQTPGLRITSGNTLTSAMALGQIEAVLAELEVESRELHVAIVGASGDIGTACARALQRRFRQLTLIGRNRHKLSLLAQNLGASNIEISTDPHAALHAHVIVFATSSPVPLLSEDELAPGTIVCDIGFPKTLGRTRQRSDVLIFPGGIAHIPFALSIEHVTQLDNPHYLFGCFTEAIVLALSGRLDATPKVGVPVCSDTMSELSKLANELGIQPAATWRDHGPPEFGHALRLRLQGAQQIAS